MRQSGIWPIGTHIDGGLASDVHYTHLYQATITRVLKYVYGMHQSLGGLGTRENITAIDFTGAVPVCELRTTSLYAWTGIHPQFHTYGLGDKHGLVHEYMRILCDPVVIHRMYGVREGYAWFGSRIEANTMRRSGGTLEVRSLRNNYEDVASTTIRQEWL